MASFRKREVIKANGQRVVKYDATVTRRGAQRKTKTFLTKTAAERWARNIESEIESGSWVDVAAAQQMAVGKALDIYVAEVAPGLKSGDCEPSRVNNLKRRLANIPLSALSSVHLVSYRDARLKDRARRSAGTKDGGVVELDRTVSAQTVKHELGLLSRALAHVEAEHNIKFPRGRPRLDHRRNNALAVNSGRDRILSADETARVIAACRPGQITSEGKYAGLRTARSPRLLPAVELLLETAARPGEITAARWRDVNLKLGTLTLKNKKKHQSKSPETRTIPLSPRGLALLNALPGDHLAGDLVFGGLTRKALSLAFRRALVRANVTDFSTRDLRHCGATRLANVLNGDLLMLSDVTGHRDIRMLRRYVSPRHKEIGRLLSEAPPAVESI